MEELKFNSCKIDAFDTIVVKVDTNIWDISDAESIVKSIRQSFPLNKIIVIPNGIQIGVIKE